VNNTAMQAEPLKYKRHWFQFSLRTLLIFMTVVALACGWLATKIEKKHSEREAVEAIIKLGGDVMYDYQYTDSRKPSTPIWLANVLGEGLFDDVRDVDLENANADAALVHVQVLTQLKTLALWESKVTDAGLAHFRGPSQLVWIALTNTSVGDAGLEFLDRLAELDYVDLSQTRITDAGLQHVKGLTQLEFLYLGKTKVTDAGLESLKDLTQLKILDLSETKTTDAGVKELQKALPNCEIICW
jgi:hypothetical protein